MIATCLAGIVWFAIPKNGKLYIWEWHTVTTHYTNGMQMSCEYVVYKWCANHEEWMKQQNIQSVEIFTSLKSWIISLRCGFSFWEGSLAWIQLASWLMRRWQVELYWCDPGEWRYPLKTLLMQLWQLMILIEKITAHYDTHQDRIQNRTISPLF